MPKSTNKSFNLDKLANALNLDGQCIKTMSYYYKVGLLHGEINYENTVAAIEEYDIRPAIASIPVQNLSGGNQQKVVIGRGLARKPKVLILDEPTAGIDVGVKSELYDIIRKLSDEGTIVILVSSDMAELCLLSDRVLVMHDGRFFEEIPGESVTQNDILMAASGVHTEGGRAL